MFLMWVSGAKGEGAGLRVEREDKKEAELAGVGIKAGGLGGSDAAGGSVCELPVPLDGRRECPRCGRQNAVGAAGYCYCTGDTGPHSASR